MQEAINQIICLEVKQLAHLKLDYLIQCNQFKCEQFFLAM